jgi:ribonuclease HI
MDIPFLPLGGSFTLPSAPLPTATPLLWTPKYQPEQWVYTDRSDIKGQPRLGAAVIHVPTCTTIYINARGTKETRTIMRADLVAIYTALDKFAIHEWVGIFTDSLSSLQAIRHRYSARGECIYTHHGPSSPQYYHHHQFLLSGITDLLEEQLRRGRRTTLHKMRSHTNIRGNYLANAAAKMAVAQYDSLPE